MAITGNEPEKIRSQLAVLIAGAENSTDREVHREDDRSDPLTAQILAPIPESALLAAREIVPPEAARSIQAEGAMATLTDHGFVSSLSLRSAEAYLVVLLFVVEEQLGRKSETVRLHVASAGSYIHVCKAALLSGAKQWDGAEKAYRRAVDFERLSSGAGLVITLGLLAQVLFAQGRQDEARQTALEGVAVFSSLPPNIKGYEGAKQVAYILARYNQD